MAATEATIDWNWWIEYCESLSAFENFAFVGFQSLYPRRLPQLFNRNEIDPRVRRASEAWLHKNFRDALYFICKHKEKKLAFVAGNAQKELGVIKGAALLIASSYSWHILTGLAVLFAMFKFDADKWCEKYKMTEFNGEGKYSGNFPERIVEGFFTVTHQPRINRVVKDPSPKTLDIPKIEIVQDAITTGKVEVADYSTARSIAYNFVENDHFFQFVDVLTNHRVEGHVEFAHHQGFPESSVLRFGSKDLEVSG